MTRINAHFAAASFCFFLFSLRAMSQPTQMRMDCTEFNNVTRTSPYLSNRDTVLSTLRNRSSLGSYSNATAGLSPNTIYGMFLCRGDLNRTSCSECVNATTLEIYESCFYRKTALVISNECIVRYSNTSFFTLVEDVPNTARYSPDSSLDSPQFFNRTLPEKLDELILRASLSSSLPVPYFVEDREHVTQLEGSYDLHAMVQCSPDLDPRNCTVCLNLAVQRLSECCSHALFVRIFFTKCLITYEISALQPNITSLGVTEGNGIFGGTFIAIMTTLVLPLMVL
ncbi:PREDICTED: putative cysteine-rich repeat secretory protein 5 [Camelina sativa]|uniref:Cysteine-rich repeat secretory protein 5 n=1 Tax=Camelina sativa TaxID=90675 RepID=A0ABM1R3J4_CAMSA|nr:PREDICTED: putative cysteine-rich repeat secretory protein 5 [Camelina sativa]